VLQMHFPLLSVPGEVLRAYQHAFRFFMYFFMNVLLGAAAGKVDARDMEEEVEWDLYCCKQTPC